MNPGLVVGLVQRDLSIFFRNRFFAIITVLGIASYVVIYFVMPQAADAVLEIGLYQPGGTPAFQQIQRQGLALEGAASEEELRQAVIDGRYIAGISLPADTRERLVAGEKPTVDVFFAPDVPEEIRGAVEVLIQDLGYRFAGQALAVEVSAQVLGHDLGGATLPPRNRLRPLLAVMLIMVETMGLATLISEEIERRTINAVLATPATVVDVFASKGITGIGLAFGQAALFMAIVGGLMQQALVVLAALLLGAVLVIAAGFVIGAMAKDMLSVLAWSLPAIIILIIPSIGVAFPGSVSGWVSALPTYHLVDTVHRASNFGAGWGDVWQSLLILLSFDLVLASAGVLILKQRIR